MTLQATLTNQEESGVIHNKVGLIVKYSASSNVYSVNTNHIRWVHGVDFSGAKDAGRRIWIATGIIKEKFLQVEQIRPGETLPNSGRERESCLLALVDLISKENEGITGLDFPFSLPAKLIKSKSWGDFILSFPGRFPTPQEFKQYCLYVANGHELKRKADQDQHTPFSPYNLRLYRQTYYGIRDLLNPHVRNHLAYTLPMQKPLPDKPWIIEICPAATLKKEHLYFTYKGRDKEQYKNRVLILEELEMAGIKITRSDLRSEILKDSDGNALDSIIAAFAAFRALKNLVPFDYTQQCTYNMEGYVYT